MALNNALKKAVIGDLSRLSLLDLKTYYPRTNHEALKFLHEKGIIDDASIEEALETVVFNQAEKRLSIYEEK